MPTVIKYVKVKEPKSLNTKAELPAMNPEYQDAVASLEGKNDIENADTLRGISEIANSITTQPTQQTQLSQPSVQNLSSLNNLVGYGANQQPAAQMSYVSPYESKINEALDRILSFDFSTPYNVTTDPLYAPMRQQYENLGQSAFNTQIGRLSALTGGRPSSAAVGVATGAQNAYAQQFSANVLPQLINAEQQRRMNQYNNFVQQLQALQGLDTTGYNRFVEDRAFGYGLERDKIADARYADETEYQRQQDLIKQTGMLPDGTLTQAGQINQLNIESAQQAMERQRLQDQISTIGQYYDNFQLEIEKREAENPDDPLLPYLRIARQEKIKAIEAEQAAARQAEIAAQNAAEKQLLDRALAIWKERGIADENVAAILGIPVGAKTQEFVRTEASNAASYASAEASRASAEKSRQDIARMQWELQNIQKGLNADGTQKEAKPTLTTNQYYNRALDMLKETIPTGQVDPITGQRIMRPKYTRDEFELWLAKQPISDKEYADIYDALDLDNPNAWVFYEPPRQVGFGDFRMIDR